ncbi:response regulator transcription factor [Shewanella baltica]|uniref:response regulator transcription factor n=1 Tax=Shewanella baltica TaxID=62322 RepID=UPI00217DDF6C|nr:response regulator [Shewanella baltica]MCS6099829.1 response regulator transcription factor [Shewanella baltica]MCS6182537.1 response regulator transcription factor [Shewanella baltica]
MSLELPVYLIDDDDSVRRSLRFMLESYGLKITDFDSAEAFFTTVDLTLPGCALVDVRMPGLSGPQLHLELVAKNSPLAVIYLTGHGDVPMAVEALKLGAVDFFQKPADGAKLAEAVVKALEHAKTHYQDNQYLETYQALTPREREILNLIAQGLKNQEIADSLCIAMRTVEIHRANLMKGMQVGSLAEMMLIYSRIADRLRLEDNR